MKKLLFFFLLNMLSFHQLVAKDSLAVDIKLDKNWCASVTSDIATWIEGYQMGSDILSVYLNVTTYEFQEFLELNNTNELTLRLFWRSNSGNQIRREADYIIDSTEPDFDIRNWTAIHEPADLEGGFYVVQVLIGDNTCSEFIPIIMVEEIDEEEPLPIDLPAYNCGEDYTYEDLETNNLGSAVPGDIFFIGGFPILLETVTGGSGTFSGTGVIPLPFDRKVVSVEFLGVHVNEKRKITSGSVIAQGDDPANYPNFNPDTDVINIGGDICLEAPETPGYENGGVDENGLDPRGFDPTTAVHSETGTNFDTNGFDMNGNYQDGTPYNQCGCSIEGLTEDNQTCDITCGPNPAAEAFADTIAANLPSDITTIINILLTENQGLLNSLGCPEIKQDMEGLNTDLGYDPVFVFGEGGKYINEDMHLHFTERPQPLPFNISTRDPKAVLLEKRHVDLYDCDKQAHAVRKYIIALNLLNEQSEKDAFVAATLTKIRSWSEYMLSLMSDDVEFQKWLAGEIGQYMMDNSGLDHSYHNLFVNQSEDPKEFLQNKIESIFDFNQRGAYHDIASIEPEMAFNETFTLEDASFLFRQGHQKINGVDRAYYLEELAKKQSLAVSEGAAELMPIIVDKTVGNKTYTIYLDQIVFSPTGASVDAFLIITDPESGKRMIFKGSNIGFGPTGLQGESRLSLESEVQVRLNNSAMFILNPSGENFVEWDCEGFSSMGIDAGIEFCRNFITPLDPATLEPVADEEARYRFDVVTVIDSWLEFNITLPGGDPFAVTKYEDIKWQYSDVILDFSSSSTQDFEPPEGFASPYYDGSQMSDLWKGVYIESLSVQFPNSFSSGSEPITASATNVLIDGGGFSGGLRVENLITIGEGNLGGWPFSIDEFHLKILNNQYAGAGMGGEVNVPIFKENLAYRAAVYPDNEYHFSVITQSDLTADVFVASVTLEENSAIDVSYVEGEFTAVATLNGTMEVNTGTNTDAEFSLKLPKVRFQDFQISNQPSYFSAGNWGMDTNGGPIASVEFNGFGIKLYGVQPYSIGETGAGVEFDLEVQFVDNEKVGVGARGVFGVEGLLTIDSDNRQSWDFDKVKLNTLLVDTHFPGVKKLYGYVNWYDEVPQYGEGFQGALSLHLAKVDIEVEAAAQFGKIEDHKYFFVDAFVKLGAAAPSIGVMKFTGFGGGVSYGMTMTQNNVSLANAPAANQGIQLPPIGSGLSGTIFTPNVNAGLAIKAACSIATAQENIFNGTVGISFEFSDSGIDRITLFGNGHFLQGVDLGFPTNSSRNDSNTRPAAVSAPLSAYINLEFNFGNSFSLDGDLRTFLNAGIIEGAGSDGLMLAAELHFSKTEWYIYIGTPDQPAGINLNLPFIDAGVTAYFDIGTNVPPMPALPANVREIAYKVNTNNSLRQSGAGFVFGAAIDVSVEVSAGSIIGATVEGGAGFDMSLRRYNNLRCAGSNSPVGIDGWYATGQIWAYIQGDVKLFGVRILQAGLAAVLQARLPNPFFAQATVGVRVKIGFIPIKKSLSIKLGEDCILTSNDPNDQVGIDVIPYLNPTNGAESIETDAKITGPLSIRLNNNIEVPTVNGPRNYRVEVVSHKIMTDQGIELENEVKYDYANHQISLEPTAFFPGNTTITAIIELSIKENGDLIATQADTTIFVTAPNIEIIPETNITYVYPINGMSNFYPEEHPNHHGYLKMDVYQSNIVDKLEEEDTYMRFTDSDNNFIHVPISYNYLSNEVRFIIGNDLLENEKGYKMELVHYTQNLPPASAIHAVPPSGTRRLNSGGLLAAALGGSTQVIDPPAEESTQSGGNVATTEQIFYTSYFRVSKYNTFIEKMEDVIEQNETKWFAKTILNETFDRVELEGVKELDPMVTIIASTNNPQLNNMGTFYSDFPKITNSPWPGCEGTIHFSSDLEDPGMEGVATIGYSTSDFPEVYNEERFLGNIPEVVVFQSLNYLAFKVPGHVTHVKSQLEECALQYDLPEVEIGQIPPPEGTVLTMNNACQYYPYDQMCSFYGSNVVKWLFPNMYDYRPRIGNYPMHVSYTLPHTNSPSSTFTVTFIKQ